LLALYEKSRTTKGAPSAAGKLAAAAFRTLVGGILAKRLDGVLVAPHLHYAYAKPDFIHLTTAPAITVRAAYDCLVVSEGVDAEPIHRRMVSLATESSFFDVYWLAISRQDALDHITDSLRTLRLQNVGVLQVDGHDLNVGHSPSGPPLPDRRSLYERFIAQSGAHILAKWGQSRGRDSKSEAALWPRPVTPRLWNSDRR
jgi:hypothetical protein